VIQGAKFIIVKIAISLHGKQVPLTVSARIRREIRAARNFRMGYPGLLTAQPANHLTLLAPTNLSGIMFEAYT
jgi:hypothetical protein